jgi:AcrR family transcriptional regulator
VPIRPTHLNDREPTDGRRERGTKTRLRVLEALLAIAAEGEVRPTAQGVADRAGVALRSVYFHFEDVDQLRRAALELQLERTSAVLRPVDASEDLEARTRAVARQLHTWYEATAPILRGTLLDEQTSTATAVVLRRYRLLRREHLARAFAPELEGGGTAGRVLLDALDAATAWESWEYLRSGLGRSATASEKTLLRLLGDLLRR